MYSKNGKQCEITQAKITFPKRKNYNTKHEITFQTLVCMQHFFPT